MTESSSERLDAAQSAEPPVVEPPRRLDPVSQPLRGTEEVADQRRSGGSKLASSVLASRLTVLCILFLATAALGIPLLWRSPAFSKNERIVWSVIVTLYTILILWLFYLIMAWSWRQISPLLGP